MLLLRNLQLGNSAIHCAAQYGQLDVVQALLENGADVNSMGVSDYILGVKSSEIGWIGRISHLIAVKQQLLSVCSA